MFQFNKNSLRNFNKDQRGMTLVEIMIVLAIIGGLMALLAPRFMGQKDKANVKETQIEIGQIMSAIEMYYNDCGRLPSALTALMQAPGDDECSNWGPEPYMKKEPKDAWGTSYVYEVDGNKYVIKSLGSDRREGGSGFAKDISSEEL